MADAAGQLFLGRQPILDREQRLVAYELLFRSGLNNAADVTDGVQATATVIANAFAELGVAAALGVQRGFINVDESFLFSDTLGLLPTQTVVLEILETVPPTAEVVERCRALKAAGFTLALDDVIQLEPAYAPLLDLVDIVKVDIQPLDAEQLTALAVRLRGTGKQLLAEKVDSRERMLHCRDLGFSLFQGYYFAKPTIIAGRKLDHSQLALLKLMGLLLGDAETAELEAALKPEPGLTVNLLRLTNSVGAGTRVPIRSLGHAIMVLGRRQLQRWLQLLIFTAGRDHRTTEGNPLLIIAAIRGRLMELLAAQLAPGSRELADQAFMTGVMSLVPALIGQPIAEIVDQLGLAGPISEALCSGGGRLGRLLNLAESSENGDLAPLADALLALPGINLKTLNQAQTQALHWAGSLTRNAIPEN